MRRKPTPIGKTQKVKKKAIAAATSVALHDGPKNWTPAAIITSDEHGIHVRVIWSGPKPLKRPEVEGWSFAATEKGVALANRLYKAVNAGVVYKNPVLKKKPNGDTFVSAAHVEPLPPGKIKNGLKRLGF